MTDICFYFQVHQPYRVKPYSFTDIARDNSYFAGLGDVNNEAILHKVSDKCYIPANKVMLELLQTYPDFKIAYSLSGVFLEQISEWRPGVLESFQKLVDTNKVEILAETYYHSLASIYSEEEFEFQVKKHSKLVKKLFGVVPKIFRNTELIYNNEIGRMVAEMGYNGIITESVDRYMDWKSPNHLYAVHDHPETGLLLKNYKLSDDIAFRFSNVHWEQYPLHAHTFIDWVKQLHIQNSEIVNLFMDYETFGEHQWDDTGIFEFLKHIPSQAQNSGIGFKTPSEAVRTLPKRDIISIPETISWADEARDLSAWRSNPIQYDALDTIFGMRDSVLATQDEALIEQWRKLTTSDHFYYMCTKYWADGDVHAYFSPYQSPYQAFIYYMNVLKDLAFRIEKVSHHKKQKTTILRTKAKKNIT